jgi:hypothetical protein
VCQLGPEGNMAFNLPIMQVLNNKDVRRKGRIRQSHTVRLSATVICDGHAVLEVIPAAGRELRNRR